MKIVVANEEIKNQIQSYIDYINSFTIKLNIKGRDKVYITSKSYPIYIVTKHNRIIRYKPIYKDISKKTSFRLRQFRFDYTIEIISEVRSCDVIIVDEKEYRAFRRYTNYLSLFHVKCKLSSKSTVMVDGDVYTDSTIYLKPLRHEFDEGYAYLTNAEVS